MEETIWSLVPPILALLMVILTRKVLLSLGLGIVVGALMLNYREGFVGAIVESIKEVAGIVYGIFISDGAINTWEFYIILFLLLLGMIASLIASTGGSRAFGEWAMARVKTRVGAQLVTVLLGIIIFIDDYFNSLTVGNVGRPLTDRHKVSRAKLAYLVDSTAAPMCVIAPVSSWGAYIITIIGGILVTHNVTQWEALTAFVIIAPLNFYALFAILMVFAVVYFKLDIGQMRLHEKRALETGEVVDKSKGAVLGDQGELSSVSGKVGDLIWPIISLIVSTVFFMIYTGIQGTEGDATILAIFENTDVASSLVYGGLLSLIVILLLSFSRKLTVQEVGKALWAGTKSMLPAIYILIFAWTIISIIGDIGTGKYLAGKVAEWNMNIAFLPLILFIIAGFMSFSTGTSWGTFGIMLPIAGDIAAATDISMMLPVLAAVLAGSIFGDHCSPISDTTILSSTGAGSHHIDHVITQLPYAVLIAIITMIGYLLLGITGSAIIGFVAAFVAFAIVLIILKKVYPPLHGA